MAVSAQLIEDALQEAPVVRGNLGSCGGKTDLTRERRCEKYPQAPTAGK